MKFHITYLRCLGLLIVGVCALFMGAPKASDSAATRRIVDSTLIFQRGQELEAVSPDGATPVVLRKKWLVDSVKDFSPAWNFSPDGKQLVFANYPVDNNFFDAGAWRGYVFIADYNTRPQVLLAAYGRQKVAGNERPSFDGVRFDSTGRKLVLTEAIVGQSPDDPSPKWISIYDIATRKRVFDGRQFIENLPQSATRKRLKISRFEAPSLSPNGNDIICLATPDDGDSYENVYTPTQKIPPTRIIHFDLKAETAEVLATLDDQFSVARTVTNGNETTENLPVRVLHSQFAWHPTQSKFVFVGPVSPTNPAVNLFTCDLKTRQTTRLTSGAQDDFSPQWSLDGKQIYWIRGSVDAQKSGANRIWRANADGSDANAILPQVVGAKQIQLLSHIADWRRYRDIPIEPLAGVNK